MPFLTVFHVIPRLFKDAFKGASQIALPFCTADSAFRRGGHQIIYPHWAVLSLHESLDQISGWAAFRRAIALTFIHAPRQYTSRVFVLQQQSEDPVHGPDGRFTPNGLRYLWKSSHAHSDEFHQSLGYAAEIRQDDESVSLSNRLMFDIRGSETAAWIADRESMKRKFAEIQAMAWKEFRDPDWTPETSAFCHEISRLKNSWTQRRRYLPILVMCQYGIFDVSYQHQGNSIYLAPHRMRADCEGAIVAIALESFHRSNSRWPQDLNELKPQFLKTLPLDPMSDRPLRYKLVDGIPHLYSVGPDRVDDGGTDEWQSESAPGDWLLLPVKLE